MKEKLTDVQRIARLLGSRGGKVAASHMTKAQRLARSRKGAEARWAKAKKEAQ